MQPKNRHYIPMRPRIKTRVHTLSNAPILVLDNTSRKPRIPAWVVVSMRDNTRIANRLGHDNTVNDLFPMRKMLSMIVKHTCMDQEHMHYFRKKQRDSRDTLERAEKRKAREQSQASCSVAA